MYIYIREILVYELLLRNEEICKSYKDRWANINRKSWQMQPILTWLMYVHRKMLLFALFKEMIEYKLEKNKYMSQYQQQLKSYQMNKF